MATFDKWLGNIMAGILVGIFAFAFLYQIFNLALGGNPGGLAGGYGNPAIYDDR